MAKSKRIFTGAVVGGLAGLKLPPGLEVGDWPLHTAGRLDCMSEILANALFLKSSGLAETASGFRGARFQDFKGSHEAIHRTVGAHRALFALQLDSVNMTDLPLAKKYTDLIGMLKAPQARTDMIIEPANYADSLLEKAANDSVFQIIRAAMDRQMPGEPFNFRLALEGMRAIRDAIVKAFAAARAKFDQRQADHGWQQQRAGSGAGDAMFSKTEIAAWEKDFDKGFGLFESNRPTDYASLVELALGYGLHITSASVSGLASKDALENYVEDLQGALK